MIIHVIYTLEADGGFILRNKYTGDEKIIVENETDIDAWEEIEYTPQNNDEVIQ